ncbi:hypothetical protein [Streptomyces sp. NPDC048606]|uniref:effector-associated constant component EACC1 n=1 Tax=Streptomyces sp. NPDC048606 TaxID=3154726 RepID=UPI00342BCA6F
MIVRVDLVGDPAGDELRRLEHWLRQDGRLRGVSVTGRPAPLRDGDMGPVLEALQLVLEPQGLLTAVAASLGTWAGVRRRQVRVRVRSGEKEVEIDASRLDAPEDVALRIVRALEEPVASEDPDGSRDPGTPDTPDTPGAPRASDDR